ncbi:hypothetical protein SK143_0824 [Streptococcus oralis]|uniref:Uncharacterized protein n=1 Tax=Streptococcus oralis TaxID=1303 RepID=A0A081R6E6_STROR|nr:hypothetical protein SK143_0824 [Streptococcus oralis]
MIFRVSPYFCEDSPSIVGRTTLYSLCEQRCSCGCTGLCIVNSSSIAYLLFSYK